jgi:hypothetical protein
MRDPTAEAPTALYLEHLLRPFGIELGQGRPPTKLLRHIDQRVDVKALYRRCDLQAYQSIQSKPMLDGVQLVLSFLGLPSNHAVFIGAYAVGLRSSAEAFEPPADSPIRAIWSATGYHYQLTKVGGLAPIEDRLVIDWGRARCRGRNGSDPKPSRSSNSCRPVMKWSSPATSTWCSTCTSCVALPDIGSRIALGTRCWGPLPASI